jgi:hypothetical protein
MVEQARNYMRAEWGSFDHTALSGYIKAASGKRLSAGTANNLVRAYITGPAKIEERVGAYYQLAHSTLDLYDDRTAFTLASDILNCRTDLLSEGSKFHKDIILAYSTLVDDLPNLEKVRMAVAVAQAVDRIQNAKQRNWEAGGSVF